MARTTEVTEGGEMSRHCVTIRSGDYLLDVEFDNERDVAPCVQALAALLREKGSVATAVEKINKAVKEEV